MLVALRILPAVKSLAEKQCNEQSQQVAELLHDPSRHRIELTSLVCRIQTNVRCPKKTKQRDVGRL